MLLVPVFVAYPVVPPKRYTYSLLSKGLIQALPAMRSIRRNIVFLVQKSCTDLTLQPKHAGLLDPTCSWVVKVMDVDITDGDSPAKVAAKEHGSIRALRNYAA